MLSSRNNEGKSDNTMMKILSHSMTLCVVFCTCCLLFTEPVYSQGTSVTSLAPIPVDQSASSTIRPQDSNLHVQNTEIVQSDLSFPAKYSGPSSLGNSAQTQETSTTDLFVGKRLWRGGEAHADLLMWQGFGLSQTLGIEAFPNGDAYKFGTTSPDFMFARLFIRQTWGLGGPQENVADDQLALAGKEDIRRVTLTVGRFTPTDVVDQNTYAGDQHTQFMSWAMIANMTWDYAADSVGFAPGFTLELNQPRYALRYGCFMMPSVQNGFTGDDQFLMWPHRGAYGPIFGEWAMNTEFERRYSVNKYPGSIRLQAWLNRADMTNNSQATAILDADGPGSNLSAAQAFRYKYGFGINWEQEVARNVGMFSRIGWNDGLEQAWAYSDVNTTASLGVSIDGAAWRRPGDTYGLAGVINGASTQNQKFLEAGGTGILAGDGKLNYNPEDAIETYYDRQIGNNIHAALDYQFVANPAFNRDRGPVSIFGARFHFEY